MVKFIFRGGTPFVRSGRGGGSCGFRGRSLLLLKMRFDAMRVEGQHAGSHGAFITGLAIVVAALKSMAQGP